MESFIVIATVFASCFVAGICGLGAFLLTIPILTCFLPVHTVVLACCATAPALSLTLLAMHGRYCRVRELAPLLLGSLPGILAGYGVLMLIPEGLLRIVLGVFLILVICWQTLGHVPQGGGTGTLPLAAGTGFLAGMLGTAIAIDGPPVAIYGLYVGWEKRAFLGTLSAYYFSRSVLTCLVQGMMGLYTTQVLDLATLLVPAGVAGTLCSLPVVKRCDPERFRLYVRLIILCGGISCLWKAFAG